MLVCPSFCMHATVAKRIFDTTRWPFGLLRLWMGDYLNTQKHGRTCMPLMRLEPVIPSCVWSKTVSNLTHTATRISLFPSSWNSLKRNKSWRVFQAYFCMYGEYSYSLTLPRIFYGIQQPFFFNSNSGGWSPTGCTRHVGHQLASCTCPGWLWWRFGWNYDWQGKPKYSGKTWPSATFSTTNPTWPDRARTRAAAVESQRLTAWAVARPFNSLCCWNT
jgi:hypothetical protein